MTTDTNVRAVSLARMVTLLLCAAGVLVTVDLAFWLTADFQSFSPPSEGPLPERLFFAGLTAAGPFAMAIAGHFVNLLASTAIACGLVALLIGVSLYWRRFLVARLAGYLGVILWFFLGFAVAGLRIT